MFFLLLHHHWPLVAVNNMFYLPLNSPQDEIRVLSILNCDGSIEPVECCLEHVSLHDITPMYRDFLCGLNFDPISSRSFMLTLRRWINKFKGEENLCRDVASTFNLPYWRWDDVDDSYVVESREEMDNKGVAISKVLAFRTTPLSPHAQVLQLPARYEWGDFQALSYCWESETLEKEIILNGNKTEVPRNLESALQALRRLPEAKDGVKFWVDFLCINQTDIIEKSHQVKRMGEIYSKALAVIPYLGESNEESEKAVDLMAQINWVVREANLEKMSHWFYSAPWQSLQDFLSRNYWQRLWIIQELVLTGA